MAAVSKVSLMALTASGSMMAAIYASQPFLKASTKTDTSGTTRNNARNSNATVISKVLTHSGSSVACGTWIGSLLVCSVVEEVLEDVFTAGLTFGAMALMANLNSFRLA